jgi:hypothetical protein
MHYVCFTQQSSTSVQKRSRLWTHLVRKSCLSAISERLIHHSIGSTLAKALFRPFEKEFGDFETKLREQNEEIKEEITLAAEKAAAKEREDASKYRTSGLVFRNEVKQLSREARQKSLGKEKRRAGSYIRHANGSSNQTFLTPTRSTKAKAFGQTVLSRLHQPA